MGDRINNFADLWFAEQEVFRAGKSPKVLPVDADPEWSQQVKELYQAPPPVKRKWGYVFWSEGDTYQFTKDSPRAKSQWGRQHMAVRRKDGEPPLETGEKPEHVWRELIFDDTGKFNWIDLGRGPSGGGSELWKQPHWDRPEVDAATVATMRVPLFVDKDESRPVRYYFFLSPVRLGPKALQAALKDADALSVWIPHDRSNKAPTPETFVEFVGRKLVPGYAPVADPYAMADQMCLFLQGMLRRHAEMQDALAHGSSKDFYFPYAKKDAFGSAYRGTPFDAYFIAKTLKAAKSTIKDGDVKNMAWDEKSANMVIYWVERYLREHQRTVDTEALWLVNWLQSPAHRIVDIAISEDTKGAKSVAQKWRAAEDRAIGLTHWFHVTNYLGFTAQGARFLARHRSKPTDCPVWKILLPYIEKGKKLDDPVDEMTFVFAAEVIPDMAIRFLLLSLGESPNLKKAVGDIAELMNNISYFAADLGRMKVPKSMPDSVTYQGKIQQLIGAELFLIDEGLKGADCLLQSVADNKYGKIKSPYLVELIEGMGETSLGGRVLQNFKNNRQDIDRRLDSTKLFFSTVNLIVAYADTASKLQNDYSSTQDRIEALVGSILDTASFMSDVYLVSAPDFKPATWKKLWGVGKAEGPRKALLSRVALVSAIGSVAAVWQIYGGYKDLRKGIKTSDYSVAVGGMMVVMGGALGLAAICVEVPVWGWVAGGIVILGGFIVALTEDHPLETFIDHSFLAALPSDRNRWTFGDNEHWSGKGSGSWPLKNQRWALQNIYAPFTVSSYVHFARKKDVLGGEAVRGVKRMGLTIKLGYVPPRTRLLIRLIGREVTNYEETKQVVWFDLTTRRFQERTFTKEAYSVTFRKKDSTDRELKFDFDFQEKGIINNGYDLSGPLVAEVNLRRKDDDGHMWIWGTHETVNIFASMQEFAKYQLNKDESGMSRYMVDVE